MKLRLEPGSIRIRLSDMDLQAWKASDHLVESLEVGNRQTISWELFRERGLESLHVDIHACRISVTVPFKVAERWIDSGETVLGEFLDVDGHGALRVVIERDLKPKMPKNAR